LVEEQKVEDVRSKNISIAEQLDDSIKARVEVEMALFPRIMSWIQLPYPKTKFAIVVKAGTGADQDEASKFSGQLGAILRGSDWVSSDSLGDGEYACPDGVTIIVRPGSLWQIPPSAWRAVEAAHELESDLKTNNILVRLIVNNNGPHQDTIDILIGKKPDLYEIRSKFFLESGFMPNN
jgi:hypothetical protein